MQNSVHINVFDFDETLFRVPGFTASEAKGLEPYQWFDSPASLDKKFNIRGIENTIERTRDGKHNMLVTHRVDATKSKVMDLLSDNGIRFDEVHFLGRGSKKGDIVLKAIAEMEPIGVSIFEDSLWEIISYTTIFLDAGLNSSVDFVFYFVDKSKIIKIDWEAACLLEETSSVERLRII